MTRTAFYPGSFDPVTLGHIDIAMRGARLFDKLVIGIGTHASKTPLFTGEERLEVWNAELTRLGLTKSVTATLFNGLTVDAARQHGASIILRGLRDGTDFDYEAQMAGMNGIMAPTVETVFLAASPGISHIAASLVRQIAAMGGDVSAFVPEAVAMRLTQKFKT